MIDEIFVLYENSGEIFPTYNKAYFNSKKPFKKKQVYYIFTPTMTRYKRVGELENAYRRYFLNRIGCEYFDIKNKFGVSQLKLIGEC